MFWCDLNTLNEALNSRIKLCLWHTEIMTVTTTVISGIIFAELDRNKFIRPTPVLSIHGKTDKIPDYLVDIVPAKLQTWIIRKRIAQHENFAEDSEKCYPHVLFIAGNNNTEKRIVRLTDERYNDFNFYTTTMERLLNSDTNKIWQDPDVFSELEDNEEPKRATLSLRLEE